jgi:hypothetical protein
VRRGVIKTTNQNEALKENKAKKNPKAQIEK